MPTVVSKLASGVDYAFYEPGPSGTPQVVKTISIAGGAGVSNPKNLHTPGGAVTIISAEEAELLAKHPLFQEHAAAGHVEIVKGKVDADKAGANLAQDAGSAPVTPADYTKKGKTPPKSKAD